MTDTSTSCAQRCANRDGNALNRECACQMVDAAGARAAVLDALPEGAETGRYDGLFSPYALFVERDALDAMSAVAQDIFEIARLPAYWNAVREWAGPLASFDPGSPGGVLGLDFHLTVGGPRLIEINTNPGGLLLAAQLSESATSCAPSTWVSPVSDGVVDAAITVWLDDMQRQRGALPTRIAIVDEAPTEQFLYPEFELYRAAFEARGIETVIRAPQEIRYDGQQLVDASGAIDGIYNRLTDFGLDSDVAAPIAAAFRAGAASVTPHPRAYALFADKRDLTVLGDAARLVTFGASPATAALVATAVPRTVVVTDSNRGALWADRARHFFKPATGFGSRGSYRGDKVTRKTWEAMAASTYVAQELTPPSVRIDGTGSTLKTDVRCFAAESGVILFAARLYQGQVTNMRTPGGGFAAVFTQATNG